MLVPLSSTLEADLLAIVVALFVAAAVAVRAA